MDTTGSESVDKRSAIVSISGSYLEDPFGGEDRVIFVVAVEYAETPDGEKPSVQANLADAIIGPLEDDLSVALEGLASLFEDDESEDR